VKAFFFIVNSKVALEAEQKVYLANGNFEQIFDAQKSLKDGITNPDQFIKQKIVDLIKKNAEEFVEFIPDGQNVITDLNIRSDFIKKFKDKLSENYKQYTTVSVKKKLNSLLFRG